VQHLFNEVVSVIFEDNREILWIGVGDGGLIKYNRSTGKRERFSNIVDDTSSLPSNIIGSVTQDRPGSDLDRHRQQGYAVLMKLQRSLPLFLKKMDRPKV
jgi:hypothetical protein